MTVTPTRSRAHPNKYLRGTPQFLVLSILTGLLLGVITLEGQAYLPEALLQLANSGAVWIVAAFVLGWYAPRQMVAALAGVLALLSALVGYYSAATLLVDAQTTLNGLILWVGTALIAGPIMGIAGYGARNATGYRQYIAKAALGAVFLGEGLYYLWINQAVPTIVGFMAIAGLVTLVWMRKGPGRVNVLLITLGGGLVFFGGYLLLNIIDMLRAGVL